ncbi:MAG: hypothetical protein MUO72_14925 [Bacteroidales bacterium]|nr:hypothetical protein [Bacteroidales bacterium]
MKINYFLIGIFLTISLFINSQELFAEAKSSKVDLRIESQNLYQSSRQNVPNPIKDYAPWITAILIVIVSSFVTWRISQAQMKTTRENIILQVNASNISNKRQEWIDNLRKNIAEIIKNHMVLAAIVSVGQDSRYMYQHEEFQKIIGLITLVDLSLNPNEVDSKNLMEMLKEYTSNYNFKAPDTSDKIERIIEATQKILKAEWNRVKRNE